MQTMRRLNDPERYYGLSWRGWLGVALAGGALYGALRISPLGIRPTVTIVVFVLAFCGVALHALSGQALGPARHMSAVLRHRLSSKQLGLPAEPERGGVILDAPRRPDRPAVDANAAEGALP